MTAPRGEKRLAAEALFRQGITSPIKVARAIDYPDSANVRKAAPVGLFAEDDAL